MIDVLILNEEALEALEVLNASHDNQGLQIRPFRLTDERYALMADLLGDMDETWPHYAAFLSRLPRRTIDEALLPDTGSALAGIIVRLVQAGLIPHTPGLHAEILRWVGLGFFPLTPILPPVITPVGGGG